MFHTYYIYRTNLICTSRSSLFKNWIFSRFLLFRSLYNSPPYGSTTASKNASSLQSSYLSSYTSSSSMTQYPSYASYNSGTTTFPNMAQNISSASQVRMYTMQCSISHSIFIFDFFPKLRMTSLPLLPQKLDYSAYSSSLYGNDRVPLQYSGYYPVPGYHAPPTSFNIGNINFAGNLLLLERVFLFLARCKWNFQ